MANSKVKGSEFEREISRFLTEWLTGQTKELYFWRSPSSGAVATINVGNSAISGDIIALKTEAAWVIDLFSIECKNGYGDASFDKVLKENKSDPILAFWEQACGDAISADKSPMLIFRKKGLQPIVGIDWRMATALYNDLSDIRCVVLKYLTLPDCHMYDMKKFFEKVGPDVLKRLTKEI